MFRNKNLHPVAGNTLTFLLLLLVFLVVAIPFKVMSVIPGFTDVRPVSMLQPVFGVFFGIPGCIAFAVGNLIGDVVSDSLRWSSIAGFAANFGGPFLYYLFLCKLPKKTFSLRTGKNLLKQVVVTLASAIVQVVLITPVISMVYPEISSWLFATTVMLNDSVFPIVLGIPLMILMQEELGFMPAGAAADQSGSDEEQFEEATE